MAGRIGGPKTRNNGRMTEAGFTSFIKGNLRRITTRWAPIPETLKEARTRRGFYTCAGYETDPHEVPASTRDEKGKRVKNALVDHVEPIIDPAVGWVSWDETINRMFCEKENLQVLCHECHKRKSDVEKAIAKARRDRLKEEENFDE
jgi:5-methylcytosine-specific restriction endonuclease McrA